MKIAAITEDGKTISQHFGRAPYYLVVTIENNEMIDRELRDKLGHAQFQGEGHKHQEDSAGRHGYGPGAEDRHARMANAIADCQVLICRGMGMGAYESMQARGIRPVVTDIASIEEAVMTYLDGRLVNHADYLH
jgi:predicted Fe-Mo cluster-binding NifX family protein